MNTDSTAPTRPRRWSGVTSVAVVVRMLTLTMSTAPLTASAASESANERESPNTTMQRAERRRRRRSGSGRCAGAAAGARARRPASTAPTAGALRRTPRPDRPGVQDALGEHRQQRDGAAEQHREQVEHDRAEQDRRARMKRMPPSRSCAGAPAPAAAAGGAAHRSASRDAREGQREQSEREPVDGLGETREQQAAERRPDDRARLRDDRPHRQRPAAAVALDEPRRAGRALTGK